MYIFQYLRYGLKLLPLQGATAPTRDTQGAASLALGYGLHWAFSPSLLNPKLESILFYGSFANSSLCLGRSGIFKPDPKLVCHFYTCH